MSAPSPAFLCKYTTTLTLEAGVAQSFDVPVNGARDWVIAVSNTGANAITAMTVASSPLGNLVEDATSITSGIPIAAGGTLNIRGQHEPVAMVRVSLTSTSGTTVSVEAGGW